MKIHKIQFDAWICLIFLMGNPPLVEFFASNWLNCQHFDFLASEALSVPVFKFQWIYLTRVDQYTKGSLTLKADLEFVIPWATLPQGHFDDLWPSSWKKQPYKLLFSVELLENLMLISFLSWPLATYSRSILN